MLYVNPHSKSEYHLKWEIRLSGRQHPLSTTILATAFHTTRMCLYKTTDLYPMYNPVNVIIGAVLGLIGTTHQPVLSHMATKYLKRKLKHLRMQLHVPPFTALIR